VYTCEFTLSSKKERLAKIVSLEGRELFEHLDRVRTDLREDQAKFAQRIGVKQASVWKWEAGKTTPSPENCARIAIEAPNREDRRYFMQRILDSLGYLRMLITEMDFEEQRWFCEALGFERILLLSLLGSSPATPKLTKSARAQPGIADCRLLVILPQ
jgi:transcriptional regulator with XRE-family HTH domain